MAQSVEGKLLTIAELARILTLPESTTRYYCKRFAGHLPFVGDGRRRRYKPEAAAILQTVADTMRRDKNAYAVDLVLRENAAGLPASLPPAPAASSPALFAEQVLLMMENQANALRDIASAMTLVAERLSAGPAPVEAAPPADDAALKQEIAALREQIRSSEALHQNDLEQLRKWLTRLGDALAAR